MKNRPLCWAALVFVCGIFICYNIGLPSIYTALLCEAVVAGICLAVALWPPLAGKKQAARFFVVLLAMPILYAGMWRMHIQKERMRTDFASSNQTITMTAVVYQYEKKETSTAVYLKDCIFHGSMGIPNQEGPSSKNIRCLAYIKEADSVKIGNKITITGKIKLFQEPSNEGQFNEKSYYQGQGLSFFIRSASVASIVEDGTGFLQKLYDFREALHNRLEELTDETTASVLQAMLLGEKGSVDAQIKGLFQDGSIGHILVISGLHFSIAGLGIYKLLKKFCGMYVAGGISMALLFLFGLMTGFGSSAVRAFIMFALYVTAQMVGRDYDLLTGLFLAIFVILARNPYTLFLPGFLLSVSAVLGIALLVPAIQQACPTKSKFLQGVGSSLGIQLFSMPASLYFYFETNPYSMFINACVLPFMPFLTVDAALSLAVGAIWKRAGRFFLFPCKLLIKGIIFLCRGAQHLPCSQLILGKPKIWQIVVYYALLFVFALQIKGLSEKTKRIRVLCPCILLFLPMTLCLKNRPDFRFTMLDVGQGQCFYLEEKGGMRMLYDGGSSDISKVGQYRIEPFLKSIGVSSLDLAMASHLDADHCSGIAELLESGEIHIQTLALPDTSLKDEAFYSLCELARENGVQVRLFGKGDRWTCGMVKLTGLHPEQCYMTDSRNDTSIIMRLDYRQHSFLFCGDMESGAEEKIIREGLLSDIDVLQVAHHGSKYSTTEKFLTLTKPQLSFISCGEDNRYGHPHEELIKRLKQSGARIFISEQRGEVTLEIRGGRRKFINSTF